MIGKVIDLNTTEAFVSFPDGTTIDIGLSHLPRAVKIGDSVDIKFGSQQMINDRLANFF